MTVFYLIRHAHANWMPGEQRPLSAKGQTDALRLADLLGTYPINGIFSSPFKRALQTVTPLTSRLGLTIHSETDLRERTLGEPGAYDFFSAVSETWLNPAFSFPGGETNAAAQLRGVALIFRKWEQFPDEHLVLSTHGNLLALVLKHYEPCIGYDFWKAMTMPDIYKLRLSHIDKPTISRLWKEQGE